MEGVRFLARHNRFPGGQDAAAMRSYLTSKFTEAKLSPGEGGFLRKFKIQASALRDMEAARRTKRPDYPQFVDAHHGTAGEFEAANIVGLLRAGHPRATEDLILVGAHYDSLGRDENGQLYAGADDNASGVSALLEIARVLSARQNMLRRSILFILFDAEEWDQLGSWHFVAQPSVPLRNVRTMLNLDSIGSGEKNKVYLVGSSIYPALAQTIRPFLAGLELTEGRNIDPFAYERGSDHFPFHERGIPALDFFAGHYRRMNSERDTVDQVDPHHLHRMAQLAYLAILRLATDISIPGSTQPAPAKIAPVP
jgi:hypothetical protein